MKAIEQWHFNNDYVTTQGFSNFVACGWNPIKVKYDHLSESCQYCYMTLLIFFPTKLSKWNFVDKMSVVIAITSFTCISLTWYSLLYLCICTVVSHHLSLYLCSVISATYAGRLFLLRRQKNSFDNILLLKQLAESKWRFHAILKLLTSLTVKVNHVN